MVKVFVRVLARRLGRFVEDKILTKVLGGFRSGRRCSDQCLLLRDVCEVQKKEKKNSYLAFLNFSKAYDSVWREGLWHKMRQYGVEEKFVKVCEALYSRVDTWVVLNGGKSRWFAVERGLRQGGSLPPLLYNIYLMGMAEELERTQLGNWKGVGVGHLCMLMLLFWWLGEG